MTDDSSSEELYCPECGYDLRGGVRGRCPECGIEIDERTLREPRIPWVHRGRIGVWRGYWGTVWMVTWRPGRVGGEVGRVVSYADARLFQRVTVWGVTVVVAGILAGAYGWGVGPIERMEGVREVVGGVLEWLVLVGVVAGVWLFLMGMSGVGSYFFHPKWLSVERQNRAVAVSYYGAGVMAWWVVTLPVAVGGWWVLVRPWEWVGVPGVMVGAWVGVGLPVVVLVGVWWNLLVMMKRATGCGVGREVGMGLLLPVMWGVLGAVVLVGIPVGVLYFGGMVLSFM